MASATTSLQLLCSKHKQRTMQASKKREIIKRLEQDLGRDYNNKLTHMLGHNSSTQLRWQEN